MRLIDADELKADYIVTSTTTNSHCYLYVSKEQIDNAPTVDTVKHGKWVHDNPLTDTLVCTECNYSIPTEELKTPYCPWCGARMCLDEDLSHPFADSVMMGDV